MSGRQKTLIVLVGPTAVGKTELCIDIARKLNTEIISADSRQIFRELKIGTAVPTPQQLKKVRHHFVASRSLYEYYTAGIFEIEALEVIRQILARKDQVLMTGGSGLYVNAVCHGIDALPKTDPQVRENLLKQYEQEGLEGIRQRLHMLDPASYEQVDLKNPKRILKALEISLTTGKPYSSFLTRKRKDRPFHILKIGLTRDRQELYDRINRRVDQMIEEGLVEEARQFKEKKHLNALNTVGYKELFSYFNGEISFDEAVRLIKRNSRRYAKRQLTWFSRDPEIHWYHPHQENQIMELIQKYIHPS
ncbi:MAG TPA: tRNA (adenosine(37)-N6)-dimethylallyltransferase MiaA [Bacteroidales bacterium]|nr:tRNA (adenosine(37)-N6)-dimethylallyltransferase MiaA [Bacteroidales bacterium]